MDDMNPATESCDVAVIGGGPSGSTVAALLARRGLLLAANSRNLLRRGLINSSGENHHANRAPMGLDLKRRGDHESRCDRDVRG
jgi:glycine/D-amino acid oxidase-like deaminating enzyme